MNDELKVPNVARAAVGFLSNKPWISLLLGISIMVAFLPGMGNLRTNFTYKGYFYPQDPMLLEFDKFERQFGNDDAVVLVVHSPSGMFDVESAELLRNLTEAMWQVPEIIRVDSLANYNWVHADGDELIVEPFLPDEGPLKADVLADRKAIALKHEVLPRYLISDDAKTALIFGTTKPGLEAPPNTPLIVGGVREIIAKHQVGDHGYHILGGPAVTHGFREASQSDALRLYPTGFVLTVIFLALLLRSLVGIALSLMVVFPAIFSALGLMGYADIELTNITFIVPQILLAIGVADSIHILVSFYRKMSAGDDRKSAAEYALLKNFMPTLLTSITTAVGFLSFTSASLKPVVGLGTAAAFGTFMAWVFTYLLLGSAIFIVPIRRKVLPPEKVAKAEENATRFTDWLIRNRVGVLGGFAAFCLAGGLMAANTTVNADPFKYFKKSYPLRVANDFVEDNFGGARGTELAIHADKDEGIKEPEFLAKVDELQRWIESHPEITRAVSIIDVLKMTNRSLHADDPAQFKLPKDKKTVAQELFLYQMSLPQGMSLNDRITIKNDAVRITVLWTITTSQGIVAMNKAIVEKGKSLGLNVVATGKNRIWQSMNGYVVESFILSVTIAFVLISIILMVFFRSVGLGLLAMIPNAIPLIIGGGVLFLIGKTLDVGVALVTSVCLGIAVDDTIHVLSNYRRLRTEGKTPRAAVIDVLAYTSPALVTTSVILIGAFGIFVFGTFVPNLYFGLMVAVILSVALITDLTFLPALLLRKQKDD